MDFSLFRIKKSYTSRRINNVFILFILAVISVATIDISSLITFSLVMALSVLLYKVLFNDTDFTLLILLFCSYTVLAVIFYWLQYYQFPQNGGCTGAGIYGGTDDLFYFQEATNKGISYRGDRSMEMHHYSLFLQFFNNLILLYKKVNLLDLLFLNILAFSFIPIVTRKVAELIKIDEKSLKLIFIMTSICPILIINGLVLVRDGWTALLMIISIYFLLRKKLLLLFTVILLAFYLRVSSAGIIMFFLGVILLFADKEELPRYNFQNRTFYIVLLVVFVIINITAVFYFLKFTTLLDNLFFREDFLKFIKETSHTKSAANFIYNLDPSLRIPLSFVFYLGSPFLSLGDIMYNQSITIRSLFEQIFPFLFFVYFIYLVRFFDLFIKIRKTTIISLLFISFILSILVLSQLSMQPRHKTILMPVFYIIVGYGAQNKNKNVKLLGFTIISVVFLLEIIYNFF